MAAKSLAKAGTKSKNINFRVTDDLFAQMEEVKAKCAQHGFRVNFTDALTAALEREVRSLQKHVQGIEPSWAPGQMSLDVDAQ